MEANGRNQTMSVAINAALAAVSAALLVLASPIWTSTSPGLGL